jgi:hypothetical protein
MQYRLKGGKMKSLSLYFNRLRWRLCDALCGDCFFNRDASLEIDHLLVENENLKARLQAAGLGD